MKIELSQYIMREPFVGTQIDDWFAGIVSKTTYPFFDFNDRIFAVSQDRKTYLAIDMPFDLLKSIEHSSVKKID